MKLLTSGSLAAILASLYLAFPVLLDIGVRSQVQLKEGNDYFSKWLRIPVPIVYKFYFFEVLNPSQALQGAKVKLREHGPYMFNVTRTRRVISWGPGNETVKYNEFKTFHFNQQLSGKLKLTDSFNVINPVLAALGQAVKDAAESQLPVAQMAAPVVYTAVSGVLASFEEGLFMKRTVHELVYGYKLSLLETMDSLMTPLRALGLRLDALPQGPPGNMFGILYGKNGTPGGPYEIYTGQGSTSPFFLNYVSFKDNTWWKDECNQLVGTDGTGFAPMITKDQILTIFVEDMCSSTQVAYTRESEYKAVKGFRFETETKPPRKCFCTRKRRKDWCGKQDGLFDIGPCNSEAPLFISMPHFYSANPPLHTKFDGLKPNKRDHWSVIDVEPTTGIPMYAAKKLQINVKVETIPMLGDFSSIGNLYIPLAWIEEEGGLTDELANELKFKLLYPVKGAKVGLVGGAIIFAAIFLSALLPVLQRRKQDTAKQVQSGPKTVNRVSPKKMSGEKTAIVDRSTIDVTRENITAAKSNKATVTSPGKENSKMAAGEDMTSKTPKKQESIISVQDDESFNQLSQEIMVPVVFLKETH
ncbi:Lysosome membrane protein 2 [Halotydeus destructor]|nr:Lysosome membrane protein 2 [Halotydeus destructor]